jgi:hypothetical protein
MDNKVYCCRAGDNRWKAYVTDEYYDTHLKIVEDTSKPTVRDILVDFEGNKGGFRQMTVWSRGLLSMR